MFGGLEVSEARGLHKASQFPLGNHTATDEGLVELDAGHHLVGGVAAVVPGRVGIGKFGYDNDAPGTQGSVGAREDVTVRARGRRPRGV